MKRLVVLLGLLPLVLAAESAAGITWKAPASWKAEAPRPMRAATYTVPGSPEPGECAVFYFGQGQGGDIEANLTRWEGQFVSKASTPKRGKISASGLPATTIDITGTYAWSKSAMSPDKINKPDYRLLGAIVQTPQGNVFFKFTAPAKVAAQQEAAFFNMIRAITK